MTVVKLALSGRPDWTAPEPRPPSPALDSPGQRGGDHTYDNPPHTNLSPPPRPPYRARRRGLSLDWIFVLLPVGRVVTMATHRVYFVGS